MLKPHRIASTKEKRDDDLPLLAPFLSAVVHRAAVCYQARHGARQLQGRSLFDSHKPGRPGRRATRADDLDTELPASGLEMEDCVCCV